MLNGAPQKLIFGNECRVLADAVVDLISKAHRPWLFRVTVKGRPPHAYTRKYDISAVSDDAAAMKGIRLFVHEFERLPAAVRAS